MTRRRCADCSGRLVDSVRRTVANPDPARCHAADEHTPSQTGSVPGGSRRHRVRLDRDVSILRGWDDGDLRDIGINRADIVAIHAGIYRRVSSDNAERIVFCPEATGYAARSNLSPPKSSCCMETTCPGSRANCQADHSGGRLARWRRSEFDSAI